MFQLAPAWCGEEGRQLHILYSILKATTITTTYSRLVEQSLFREGTLTCLEKTFRGAVT